MVIVSRHRELAEAYAVHILDVYDHYRFRAIETERKKRARSNGPDSLKLRTSGKRGTWTTAKAR